MTQIRSSTGIECFVKVEVMVNGKQFADPIFMRRYREIAPDFPHHVIASCKNESGEWVPTAYIHFTGAGDILLGGGACVDDRVLRQLGKPARKAIKEVGGLYFHSLQWAIGYFAMDYSAIFGYCGDVLAERIDLMAGFAKTNHVHLLVYFTREMPESDKQHLIEKASKFIPF